MTAAIAAARRGLSVLLLEQNPMLGKKLRITGKGRCNITNACDFNTLMANIPGNSRFLYSAFHQFSNFDLIQFMHEIGVETVTERGGRVFPASGRAFDVAEALRRRAAAEKVRISCGMRVTELVIERDLSSDKAENESARVSGVRLANQKVLQASHVVIATGGITYPATGSTGDGYRFAQQAGHTIIPPRPALSGLLSPDSFIRDLEGLSLRNIAIVLYSDQAQSTICYRDFGEMLFTGSGISGPVILSCSRHLPPPPAKPVLCIDLKPALSPEKTEERLQRDFSKYDRKYFIHALDDLLPKRLIPVFVAATEIPSQKQVNQITKEERKKITALLKGFPIHISGTAPVSEAIITAGGVCVKEINPKTMESKRCAGLYFAGEVLDTDGYTGGYNLTIAFSTGWAAGGGQRFSARAAGR